MHRVILPAEQIPVGSTVTKVKGNKEYKLVNGITVYRKRPDWDVEKTRPSKIEVFGEDDEVVLVPTDGSGYANIEQGSKELVWLASPEEFAEYVSRKADAETAPY